MDKLYRNGAKQVWLKEGTVIDSERIITSINGNSITFDAPLTDSFDSNYLGAVVGTVLRYSYTGRISKVGVQALQIVAPAKVITDLVNNIYNAITMQAVMDAWVINVKGVNTQNAFDLAGTVKRVTIDRTVNEVLLEQTISSPASSFQFRGSQILITNCASYSKKVWPLLTMGPGAGPSVFANFTSSDYLPIEPHMRWSTGLLVENATLSTPESGVSFINRANMGSGHGWCNAWSVVWNSKSDSFVLESAPGSMNWCIGCVGKREKNSNSNAIGLISLDGTFDSMNEFVNPASLYNAQLAERLSMSKVSS